VNTNKLTKLYDQLTALERLPLIVAATQRGDQAERERLIAAAPRVTYSTPDYTACAEGFLKLSDFCFMELADLAARYLERVAALDTRAEDEQGRLLLNIALAFGYTFKVKLAGWRRFCADHHLDAEACWSGLPGLERIKRAEALAQVAAFLPEGMARFREMRGQDPGLMTAASVAAGLQECFRALTNGAV
jgi:hypothetical protein